MLAKVKAALRITVNAYDAELNDLISAALGDLGIAGITIDEDEELPTLVKRAIIMYCRFSFGSPSDYDRLKAAYDELKAQLQMATGYTDWGDE